ncbi:MAG: transcription antitermination factor NusB, partial [Saccharofermentanales bacterium]
IRPDDPERQKELFFRYERIHSDRDRAYFERVVDGVQAHRDDIDAIIERYLRGWTLERQLIIDLSILRLAVYEMLFDDEVPSDIAISEAVVLANAYGTDDSRAFINAVLGNIARHEPRRIDADDEKAGS